MMLRMILSLLLFVDNPSQDYKIAYQKYYQSNKPMIVVLTAKWCAPCGPFKNVMRKFFILTNKYSYVEIDVDQNVELASKIKVGETLPQTAIFYRENNKAVKKIFNGGGEDISLVKDFLAKIRE